MSEQLSLVLPPPPKRRRSTARELGDAGMQKTLEAEREAWLKKALEALAQFAAMPEWREFKTEDFRAWATPRIGAPHSHKVWGALTNRACPGVIRWTGKMVPSVSPKTHGHYVKVWTGAGGE